jgi:hypothetical protein
MKCRIYGISLLVSVSILAALVLRSHVPMTTVKEAVGITAVKSDATAAQSKVTNRSHLTALPRVSQMQLLETYGKLPLSFEANQGQTDSQVQFIARGGGYHPSARTPHDSGPMSVASPSSRDFFIHYTSPVLTGAQGGKHEYKPKKDVATRNPFRGRVSTAAGV